MTSLGSNFRIVSLQLHMCKCFWVVRHNKVLVRVHILSRREPTLGDLLGEIKVEFSNVMVHSELLIMH